MHRILIITLLAPINLLFCQETNSIKTEYPDYIGDIAFDKETDMEEFELCSSKRIYQYFNNSGGFEYEGEKLSIEKVFAERYKSNIIKNETGLIRIRFVVNCDGETDRFRLISVDNNYHKKVFHQSITSQLLHITQNLKGWKKKIYKGKVINYYQYLTFKIEDGQIKEILP